jgi:hypothetical protein
MIRWIIIEMIFTWKFTIMAQSESIKKDQKAAQLENCQSIYRLEMIFPT